jgi:hypothetical protein
MELQEILQSNNKAAKLALFKFSVEEPNRNIALKFNLWARYFFPKYFERDEAYFHKQIDDYNIGVYKGNIKSFTDIAFRGSGKTSRTKLFIAYCIANNKENYRKYIKVLTKDITNSKQIVTDIYNLFVDPRHMEYYPDIFAKTEYKREETMQSFTTATGIKLIADTVGTDQRGQLQDNARPDLIWFEDFETRKTLRSAVETHAIWDNMEEARTGLSRNGGCIYTCNYISERGNVHKLVQKESPQNTVIIIPIINNGIITWDYTKEQIAQIEQDAEDFEGEYLCKPSASMDVQFDRDILERMRVLSPIREIGGFKIYSDYDPSHRYASGHDVAGGVGLDSSTSVFMDFHTFPVQVVGTYKNNTIKPDVFADEIEREGNYFSNPLVAIEKNNHGHATIARAKQLGLSLYMTRPKPTKINYTPPMEYGWHTNAVTKPKMIFDFVKAVENGHIELNDFDLINECKSYTRDDLMDKEEDPRLNTRHFDLLMAAAICYQMKDHAKHKESEPSGIFLQSKLSEEVNEAL